MPPPDQTLDPVDVAAIDGAKRTLRKAILFRRDMRSAKDRQAADEARMSIIESSLADRMPDTVAAYLSNGRRAGLASAGRLARLRTRSAYCCPCCRIRSADGWTSRPGRPTRARRIAHRRLLDPGADR